MTGLPPGEVLLDAAAVLRQLADAATPGPRSIDQNIATVGKQHEVFGTEGDAALWAAFGPDEARLLADLLEIVPAGSAEALNLAYALTGHQRPDGGTQ